MNTKKGAGGKPQAYDSKGKYARTNKTYTKVLTHKEKHKIYELLIEELNDRIAIKSDDPLLRETYLILKKALPKTIKEVNVNKNDDVHGGFREFDFVLNKCIIELKSGDSERAGKQFMAQLEYCQKHNKKHLVYAPNIGNKRYYVYSRMGIDVSRTIEELISKIKEYEK